MEYRRRLQRDVWHLCKNCSQWPRRAYQTRNSKPTTGELCDQCLSKRRRKICK